MGLGIIPSDRTQKIKDARSEAAKEIEELKATKEAEFKKTQKEHEGSSGSNQAKVDAATADQLKQLEEAFKKNRSGVVDKLLERVVEVDPQPHRNLKTSS
ncbi:hypothetical protein IE81DRAFT_326783 [Ceraceosorus guamensis]|uniref:V-type proton ATPase subunit G n=1 Tax=Ceraceosorus guamensis TaxID=1522189 RepID=A0A316VNI8_9BASI|nr:hypothetical protein IE81DRAFT_326783 [Ceraceosorus guamensis]PWN39199.1 hypothetical protein IE81DRAFT_326783 [Ceraceosorus guamensis]